MPIMASLVAAGHHLSRPNEECYEVSDAISDFGKTRMCMCGCGAGPVDFADAESALSSQGNGN